MKYCALEVDNHTIMLCMPHCPPHDSPLACTVILTTCYSTPCYEHFAKVVNFKEVQTLFYSFVLLPLTLQEEATAVEETMLPQVRITVLCKSHASSCLSGHGQPSLSLCSAVDVGSCIRLKQLHETQGVIHFPYSLTQSAAHL